MTDLVSPITIKYRNGKLIASVKADSATGEVPAGSNIFYYVFLRAGGDSSEASAYVRVAEKAVLPRYRAKAKALRGRFIMRKLFDVPKYVISNWRNYEDEIGGLPPDTEAVYRVNGGNDWWLIRCTNPARIILHVMNNGDQTCVGEFKTALRSIFCDPAKTITLVWYETIRHEEIL